MSDTRGKVLVSGASSGIGAATAKRFAAEGCDLCLNARRREMLEQLAAEFPPGGDHIIGAGDYSEANVVRQMGEMICSRWGRLDVLVNCAGISESLDVIDSPIDQWRRCLDTMLNGAIHLSRMAAPLMTAGGRIIHVTSIHARRAEKNASSYGMAKAAIEQLCRSLALELADRGILVNALAPGFVDTPMSVINGVNELETDWFRRNYVQGHHLPLRRAARPEEVAGVAVFLAGPDATYITGQTIIVDGGLTITF